MIVSYRTHLLQSEIFGPVADYIQLNRFVYPDTRDPGAEPINLVHVDPLSNGGRIDIPRHLVPESVWDAAGHPSPINTQLPDQELFDKAVFTPRIVVRKGPQQDAWDALKRADYGTLNLACGVGKTVLALLKAASRGYATIVFVHTGALLNQWAEEAKTHLGLTDDEIGIAQGANCFKPHAFDGKLKTRARTNRGLWEKPFVIAMIQSVAAHQDQIPEHIRCRFGTVFFDEAHHIPAHTFMGAAEIFLGNKFALSATPEREDKLEAVLYAIAGPVFHSYLTGDLTARVFVKMMPTVIDLTDPDVLDRVSAGFGKNREVNLQYLIGELTRDEERNQTIIRDCARAVSTYGRKVLALTHSVDHTLRLEHLLVDYCKANALDITVAAISGVHTKYKDRKPTIMASDVTFSTVDIAKEGLSVNPLDTLFFLTPYKNWPLFFQGKGRIERAYYGKKTPYVMIYLDATVPMLGSLLRKLLRKITLKGLKYEVLQRPRRPAPPPT